MVISCQSLVSAIFVSNLILEKKMATINFVLRPSSRKGRHPGSLTLRVIHGRKPKTATTGCRLYAEEWDVARQEIIYPPNDPQRAAYLDDARQKIIACAEKIAGYIATLEKHGRYTADEVIGKYRRNIDDGKLLGYAETLAVEQEQNEKFRLADAYRTVSNRLVEFNKSVDIPLEHINTELIKAFETELMNKGRKPNTISFYMRNLRAIYNKAVAAGRITGKKKNPFAGVYTKVHQKTAKRALTVEETTNLYEIDSTALLEQHFPGTPERLRMEGLYFSWRLYMFAFFAQGMCFIDVAYLRKECFKDGMCTYYRKKTNKLVEVQVNEGMQQIIDSLADEVKDSPYVFPIVTGEGAEARKQYESALRSQNRRLKALAKLACVEKKLSMHVARHSFATIVRSGGMPAGVISEMMGHSTEKMTHNYFASFDRSYSEQAYHIIVSGLSRAPLPA